jgi:predicted lysophospholipase L1 biosynthesis ABC-type transport system permease subunit
VRVLLSNCECYSRNLRARGVSIALSSTISEAAIESSRTVLEDSLPNTFQGGFAPLTVRENQDQGDNARRAAGNQRLTDIVILTSLPIAGCTLAVSIIGGINDRRRAFSLLRLAGTPLSTLRRVIAFEAAVPLLVSSITAIGIGFLTAYLFLRSQLDEPLSAPGLSYYLCVGAGLIASLGIIATTFPVLRRTTGPAAARNV